MAERRCGCGGRLEDAGNELRCLACGCWAGAWTVVSGGRLVAAADGERVYLAPGLLTDVVKRFGDG